METAYLTMWKQHREGLAPETYLCRAVGNLRRESVNCPFPPIPTHFIVNFRDWDKKRAALCLRIFPVIRISNEFTSGAEYSATLLAAVL